MKLVETPLFSRKPTVFDRAVHNDVALYFCDTCSKLAVTVVNRILTRGLPVKIIHIDVDPKRTEALLKRSREIAELNGWDEGLIDVIEEPYRDLYQNVATLLDRMRADYPNTYFHVYVGALRTRFPFNLLHMSTDRFLRDDLLESDDVSLTVKQINLDSLPLPEGFKVTFEHAPDHHESHDNPVQAPQPTA